MPSPFRRTLQKLTKKQSGVVSIVEGVRLKLWFAPQKKGVWGRPVSIAHFKSKNFKYLY